MKLRAINGFLCVPLVFLSGPVRGEEPVPRSSLPVDVSVESALPPATLLQDLTVTGTRTPKALADTPVRTEVVSAEEIRDQRHRDASQALLDVPGVTLVDSTGKEGKSAVMQGMGGEHVLVLIDGAPVLQSASSGVDLTHIPTADIQRIEVVKGGASALYGSQAMGGVINVITKNPTEKFRYEIELGRDVSSEGEGKTGLPYNQVKAHARGQSGPDGFKLTLNHRDSRSLDRDPSTITRDTPDVDRWSADGSWMRELTARDELRVDLSTGREINRSYAARLLPDSSYRAVFNDGDVQRQRARLSYKKRPSENSAVNAYLLTERTRDSLSMGDDPGTSEAENLKSSLFQRQRLELQWDGSPVESQILTLGLVAERGDLSQSTETRLAPGMVHESTEVDGRSSRSLEAFAQNDWILDGQEVVLGLRASDDAGFGQRLTPKANWMIQTSWFENLESRLRFSAGTGYRIPNLKERFYILDHRAFAGYVVYGNENLRPEESVNYQAGLELRRSQELSFNVNLFANQIRGLIVTTEVPTTGERVFRFENLDDSFIYGVETSASWQIAQRWRVSPSFTHTKALNGGDGLIVPNRPFYTGQLSTQYQIGDRGSKWVGTLRYFGESYANLENTERYVAYGVADLKYNHRLNANTEIFVGALNLLDAKRAARTDSPDIVYDQRPDEGRLLTIGLNLEGAI